MKRLVSRRAYNAVMKSGFRPEPFEDGITLFRHQDDHGLELYLFHRYRMFLLLLDGYFDRPLYNGPINDPDFPDILKQSLNQVLIRESGD